MKSRCKILLLSGLLYLLTACYKEKVLPVTAGFTIEVINNDYSAPVRVNINNITEGAQTYTWTFQGANPVSSSAKEPGVIEYTTPGSYKILLEAANESGGYDSSEITLTVVSTVSADFSVTNNQSYYAPVIVNIQNTSAGAEQYDWSFEGGAPATSAQQQPGSISFTQPGTHKITLHARNAKETQTKEVSITVLPALQAIFDIQWPAENNDHQAPFKALISNHSSSATQYQWNCPGGSITDATAAEPEINYHNPGTYTITLTAGNDKTSQVISKTITVLPNTNLFTFSNVRLGINTADNTIGCYFSAALGKVLTTAEVNAGNGDKIDFVYFGLNNSFTYNRVLSPADAADFTFPAIPGAASTVVINKQESYISSQDFTPVEFDAMLSDVPLQPLSILYSAPAYAPFDNTMLPRVLLFKTSDGRKGAIKIRQFVENGSQSYLLCDIRLMKRP